jgi:hypothetical protein
MAFVQRDEAKKICGVYSLKQPGYAEEELADDDVEVLTYREETITGSRGRRIVRKSDIVTRLHEAGLLAAASKALNADLYTRERWYAADYPAIYADDPEALALLKAIGADPEVILA